MKPEQDAAGYAVKVKGVKKKFKIYFDKGSSLKERILFKNRSRHEERWVLKGIDFEIKKGEAVGLIGKNGCGKSTILKMLARILYPTEGAIEMKGRVSSLIELGAGFHPDMSGRENIFTNASIFGLSRREIEKRLDTIIRFSELGDFIDNPVRTYSSGMYMRLAFAVAINVDADILLIDEILAVGDAGFQEKCFEKLKEIRKNGTTVIIVSHAMDQIKNICDRVIWIEEGLVYKEGKPREIAACYLKEMERQRMEKIEHDYQQELKERRIFHNEGRKEDSGAVQDMLPDFCRSGTVREGNLKIRFTDAAVESADGKRTMFFQTGEKMQIRMKYHAQEAGQRINFTINISRDDGVYCFGTSALSGLDGSGRAEIIADKNGEACMVIENNYFLKGRYLVDIGIQDMQENKFDYIYNALEFRVKDEGSGAIGIVHLPRHWETGGRSRDDGNDGTVPGIRKEAAAGTGQ